MQKSAFATAPDAIFLNLLFLIILHQFVQFRGFFPVDKEHDEPDDKIAQGHDPGPDQDAYRIRRTPAAVKRDRNVENHDQQKMVYCRLCQPTVKHFRVMEDNPCPGCRTQQSRKQGVDDHCRPDRAGPFDQHGRNNYWMLCAFVTGEIRDKIPDQHSEKKTNQSEFEDLFLQNETKFYP